MSFKVCKYTRSQQLYVISYSLIKSYFSDEHFLTFSSSPESRRPHSLKSVQMHHLASLLSTFSKQFQLPKDCFKQRQNASLLFLSSYNFKNIVSNSVRVHHTLSLIFLLSSECIFYCPCFQHFLIRFNFQKHCSKCARMHLLVFLVSKLSQQCQLSFIGQCFR